MILVCGATGLVGGSAIEALLDANVPVRALVRSRDRGVDLEARGVEIAVGDLADPESLDAAMTAAHSLLLISPVAPAQVALQRNAVDAAQRSGIEHIVKLSGLATALDSPVRSGRWHAETETAIVDANITATFLHPPYFMQNLLRLAPGVAKSGSIRTPLSFDVRIAMVDGRDVGRVAAACLLSPEHRGATHVLTGPEALTHPEVAARLSNATGRTIECIGVGRDITHQMMLNAGMPQWHVDLLMEFNRAFYEGAAEKTTEAVEQITGRSPTNVDAFLSEHATAFG